MIPFAGLLASLLVLAGGLAFNHDGALLGGFLAVLFFWCWAVLVPYGRVKAAPEELRIEPAFDWPERNAPAALPRPGADPRR